MLRKVLRRSAAARLTQSATPRRAPYRLLVHTNACKQEDVDGEERTAVARTGGSDAPSRAASSSTFTTDHRDLFGSGVARTPRSTTKTAQSEPRSAASAASKSANAPAPTATLKLESTRAAAHGISARDLETARAALATLSASVQTASAAVAGESDYQRHKRLQKAMTGPLDKLLYRCRQRRDFAQVEAIAFVWDDVLPQFAGNRKHRTIICEHYARSLNSQQRFRDVIDKLLVPQLLHARGDTDAAADGADAVAVNRETLILSPALAEAIWLACGHVKDSTRALQLLEVVRTAGVRISKVAYFHVLNTLLKDDTDDVELDTVLQLCDEVVHDLHDSVPLSLLPTVIRLAAQHGELDRAMRVYAHAPDAPMCSFTEFRFEICLQTLCDLGYASAMLEVYRHVMDSTTATRGVKERISKCLLQRCVRDRRGSSEHHQGAALGVALELLETMQQHGIAASHHCVYPLLRALLQADELATINDVTAFFARYGRVVEWNAFALCEAVIACVYCKQAQLVDELFVHALDHNIPIKYAALERVISFYYKLGMLGDLEKVADMIRALRLNKHIPLGIAVTEIGMASNLRLGRFDEVVHLFEDFSALDGDRKRILTRRLMLKSALKAYAALNRLDESNAIRALLRSSYGNVLEHDAKADHGDSSEDDDDDHRDFFTESIDNIER